MECSGTEAQCIIVLISFRRAAESPGVSRGDTTTSTIFERTCGNVVLDARGTWWIATFLERRCFGPLMSSWCSAGSSWSSGFREWFSMATDTGQQLCADSWSPTVSSWSSSHSRHTQRPLPPYPTWLNTKHQQRQRRQRQWQHQWFYHLRLLPLPRLRKCHRRKSASCYRLRFQWAFQLDKR